MDVMRVCNRSYSRWTCWYSVYKCLISVLSEFIGSLPLLDLNSDSHNLISWRRLFFRVRACSARSWFTLKCSRCPFLSYDSIMHPISLTYLRSGGHKIFLIYRNCFLYVRINRRIKHFIQIKPWNLCYLVARASRHLRIILPWREMNKYLRELAIFKIQSVIESMVEALLNDQLPCLIFPPKPKNFDQTFLSMNNDKLFISSLVDKVKVLSFESNLLLFSIDSKNKPCSRPKVSSNAGHS